MFYVYILLSIKTGEFYKGLSENLNRRIEQHFDGKSPSTKNKRPLRLIHVEICTTRTEARNMEKFFKSGYGREVLKELVTCLDK